ncbi:CRISPR-associated RAMP protein Csx7 [Dehalococcoidia bacterium]|nr:CRISPR-associated RAMP protein Csx7 [Dehalococcoidia bacterium]
MFEKLENRYFFTGKLVLENEMHIGSGKGDGTTDALVVKDFNEKPFIPGSSVRGVLRSTIERIAASLGKNPCLLESDNCVTNSRDVLQKEFKKLLEKKNKAQIDAFLNNDSKICSVCRLFGSTVVASKIRITDLLLKEEKAEPSVRHGVAINRDTETAQDKAKFDFEAVPKESSFSFELIGENLTDDDRALLAVGIQEMINGNFWLGGNTARGLGKCKLEELKIEYFEGADGLKGYLKDKRLEPMTPEDFLNSIKSLVREEARYAQEDIE